MTPIQQTASSRSVARGGGRKRRIRGAWTYASVALARGVHPKVVQEAMGHANISVTLDLYSHVVPTLQRDAVREIGAALLG
jgi:integrase